MKEKYNTTIPVFTEGKKKRLINFKTIHNNKNEF